MPATARRAIIPPDPRFAGRRAGGSSSSTSARGRRRRGSGSGSSATVSSSPNSNADGGAETGMGAGTGAGGSTTTGTGAGGSSIAGAVTPSKMVAHWVHRNRVAVVSGGSRSRVSHFGQVTSVALTAEPGIGRRERES